MRYFERAFCFVLIIFQEFGFALHRIEAKLDNH